MGADNSHNFKPMPHFGAYPPEKRREMARNGAIKTNQKIAAKKMVKELAMALMEQPLTEKELAALRMLFPKVSEEDCINKTMLIASLKQQAIKGNVKAIELLLAIMGELPAKEITGNVVTQKVFISAEQKQNTISHIEKVIADDGHNE